MKCILDRLKLVFLIKILRDVFCRQFRSEKTVMDLHRLGKRNVGWSFLFASIIFISHAYVSLPVCSHLFFLWCIVHLYN